VIVPSRRLIWVLALAGFPAVVIQAVIPQARIATVALIVSVMLAALVDALLRKRVFDGLHVELPGLLRLVQGRETHIAITIHNGNHPGRRIRIGFAMPAGIEMEPEEQSVDLPAAVSRRVAP
jgi:uncharacterized protein (DUF58 family)